MADLRPGQLGVGVGGEWSVYGQDQWLLSWTDRPCWARLMMGVVSRINTNVFMDWRPWRAANLAFDALEFAE